MPRKAGTTPKERTVQSVKNSLKFKAQPRSGILSLKIGVKKYAVPVEARMISGGSYLFLSFPAVSELFKVENKDLIPLPSGEDATEAYGELNPTRRRGRRRSKSVNMPPELAEALKGVPSGYKLGYGADGTPKLVKTRKRRTSKGE
jgi:hypothetical protein